RRESEPLKLQGSSIPLDRSDGHKYELTRWVEYWLVVGTELRCRSSAKRKSPTEVLRRGVDIRLLAQPYAEFPGVPASGDGCHVLKLVVIPHVDRMANLGSTSVERSKHLNRRIQAVGGGFSIEMDELEPGFVDYAVTHHRSLCDLH